MKKWILIIIVGIVVTLSGCETPSDTTLRCSDGFVMVDDECIPKQTETCPGQYELPNGECEDLVESCPTGFEVIDNKCEEKVLNCIPGYHQEGDSCVKDPLVCEEGYHVENDKCVEDIIEYTGRELVPDECVTIDNIGAWQPVWCDEFNGTGLPDSSKWSYDVGGHGWGNNELQYYTDADLDNVFVKDGYLTIKAIKESFGGNSVTSTRLISKEKGDFLYGKIQVSAKLPTGLGTWPAIWMLPTEWKYGGWPTSGEIDIMEHVGYDLNRIHGTIHTGAYNHMLGTQVGHSKIVSTATTDFHVYEIEWEPNVIRFYIDGEQYHEVGYNEDDILTKNDFDSWPFDEEFHLILNIAFGGAWGGAQGVDYDSLPAEMVIDYVRVFQKNYAGMDQEVPDAVTNVRNLRTTSSKVYLAWDKGTDDMMVSHYNVYVNDVLMDTTTHHAIVLEGLQGSTEYSINIVSVDFAGNEGLDHVIQVTTGSNPTINDRIEAEHYDTSQGIDTETTDDSGGGLNVGWTDVGDYMTYQLIVPESGTYHLDVRYAGEGNGRIAVYANDTLLTVISMPSTGGWQNWQTATSTSFQLNQGQTEFKVVFESPGSNVNYFDFVKE